MPEHGLDIAALLLLLVEETGAASIRNKLELRQDDDGIDTPDDDDDDPAAPAPAPTTTAPATATTSAASTETASSARQLDTGSKAGIAIGVIVGVIFIGGAVFMYWRHRRQRRWQRRNKYDNKNNNDNGYDPNRPPNMAMVTHNIPPKSASDSSPPLGSVSPPSTNPDAGRAWFDNGPGSSELPSREAREGDGVAGWVYDKAELSAPEAGGPQAPGQLHPHQYHQYSHSTELPTAGNQIHEIPEASACSYAPVELPAVVPDQSFRHSGFTGFSGGEGEDIGRNVSTRTSNTDGSGRRESAAPTFTVSSPATTVAETVSDSGYGTHAGQVSPASPYARTAAGGNTI